MSRTSSFGSNSVTYPNSRVFAFSPYKATITGTASNQLATITWTANSVNYSIKRYTDSANHITLPLQGIFQSFFVGRELGAVDFGSTSTAITSKAIRVTIGSNYVDMTFDVIWGALQIGETERTVEYMYYYGPSYPLTLNTMIGTSIRSNLVPDSDLSIYPYNNLDMVSHIVAYPSVQYMTANTGSTIEKTYYIVNKANCIPNEGIYLRWIDQYGQFKYYFFQIGSTDTKSVKGASYSKPITSLDGIGSSTGTLYKSRSELKNKSFGKVINCGESSADDNLTTMIEGLQFSLKQWAFIGNKWIEVFVDDMEISRKRMEGRREISLNVILPDYYTQSL